MTPLVPARLVQEQLGRVCTIGFWPFQHVCKILRIRICRLILFITMQLAKGSLLAHDSKKRPLAKKLFIYWQEKKCPGGCHLASDTQIFQSVPRTPRNFCVYRCKKVFRCLHTCRYEAPVETGNNFRPGCFQSDYTVHICNIVVFRRRYIDYSGINYHKRYGSD